MKSFSQWIGESYDPSELDKIKGLLLSDFIGDVKLGLILLATEGQVKEYIRSIEKEFISHLRNFQMADIVELDELFEDKNNFTLNEYGEFMEYVKPYRVRWSIVDKRLWNSYLTNNKITVYKTIFSNESRKLIAFASRGAIIMGLFNDDSFVTPFK
jgi:hypothetical protein